MKRLFAVLILLITITSIYSSDFDADARQEFQQLSNNPDRYQPYVNTIRALLKKPTSTTILQNFEGVEAMHYAINNKCCALPLALAYRGVPLFISDRNSKLFSPLCVALNKFPVSQFERLLSCAINAQGYHIDQLDNYDRSLLEQLFRIPNFTPPIEMIELLVARFKAEVNMADHCLAHAKLSSYNPKDHQRFFELMGYPYSSADTQASTPTPKSQSASPEVIAEINRTLKAACNEAKRKSIPHAEELFTQIKLRLARMNRKMRSPSIVPKPAHALIKTQEGLAISEKSGTPQEITTPLNANQNPVNTARVATDEKNSRAQTKS